MDSKSRSLDVDLDECQNVIIRCTQVGEPFKEAERRQGLLRVDRVDEVRLIIPQSGTAGSNPAPATNFMYFLKGANAVADPIAGDF